MNENSGVSWQTADVADNDSGMTTMFGGDIRPTLIHNLAFTIYN